MIVQTLYKKNKLKIQVWQIEVESNKYRSIEGFKGGAMTTSEWTIAEGKNIGRSNETTPTSQATIEAFAKIKLKLDSGYVEDISDINKAVRFKPMLAEKWKDFKHKIVFPCYVQPKSDGMRCNTTNLGSSSREGKPIVSVPHITTLFDYLSDGIVIDGELYNHNLHADFNKIISVARKTKPTPEDLIESEKVLKYYVYDAFFTDDPGMLFKDRYANIKTILNNVSYIEMVDTYLVNTPEEIQEFYEKFLEDGYEGIIIRNNAPYAQKRTTNLLKRKEWLDDEFEIVDITEGKGNRSGMMGRIALKTKSGEVFEADGSGLGGHEVYKLMLADKASYIGKMATVRYQNLTPDRQVPRFPKIVAIRDYE